MPEFGTKTVDVFDHTTVDVFGTPYFLFSLVFLVFLAESAFDVFDFTRLVRQFVPVHCSFGPKNNVHNSCKIYYEKTQSAEKDIPM